MNSEETRWNIPMRKVKIGLLNDTPAWKTKQTSYFPDWSKPYRTTASGPCIEYWSLEKHFKEHQTSFTVFKSKTKQNETKQKT